MKIERNVDELTNKHVFFISDADKFFFLLADSLINKMSVPPSSIVAVVYKSGRQPSKGKRLENVRYLNYDETLIECYSNAMTITFMSLLAWNSCIARALIDQNDSVLKKLFIFITDDEVARWRANFEEHGRLLPDPRKFISEDCIFTLKRIKNFICPEAYFKEKIAQVVGRDDLSFYNATIVFDILPCRYSRYMREIVMGSIALDGNKKRILYKTKACGWKSFLFFLRIVFRSGSVDNADIYVFIDKYRRLPIFLYILFQRLLGKTNIDVIALSNVPPPVYNSLLAACTHIILQDRGGASTARVFLKWGRGEVLVKKDSPNHFFFEDAYGVDIKSYANDSELLEFIAAPIGKSVLSTNSQKLEQEEMRSLAVLSEIYC